MGQQIRVLGFSWLGRPVIQLPEDLVRMQELIWRVQPDVIVETGVAHGGSLVFYASLFAAIGAGRAIGVDVSIRPENRAAILAHRLAPCISLIEGSSTEAATVAAVRAQIAPGERVLVVLDSDHRRAHVRAELDLYSPLVSPGSYVVVCDGIMAEFAGSPRGRPEWAEDNPLAAAQDFLATSAEFVEDEPPVPVQRGRGSRPRHLLAALLPAPARRARPGRALKAAILAGGATCRHPPARTGSPRSRATFRGCSRLRRRASSASFSARAGRPPAW